LNGKKAGGKIWRAPRRPGRRRRRGGPRTARWPSPGSRRGHQ